MNIISAATALTATTDYTMFYNSNASSNVGNYTATATGTGDYSGTVTANYSIKSAATATAPTAKTPTYNGTAQELVNAGTVNNGTMKYRLGDTGDYSTAIPTATSAGTYTVYWKVEPAANYAYINTADQKVTVTISKKAPEVSEFTFTAPGAAPIVYDGNAKVATP